MNNSGKFKEISKKFHRQVFIVSYPLNFHVLQKKWFFNSKNKYLTIYIIKGDTHAQY